ncbi:MAG: NUDIX hydrolase, partial [Gammaproteobacteria bacterium]|nr:NUDIX hydrolase [Gammaproteobacteria bacterium]
GIEPRKGKWTLPAGFMENGESTLQGAIRETYEEACAKIDTDESSLYTLFNLPRINQVYLFFRASLKLPNFSAGMESLDVQLFDEQEIPWDEIAFPVVRTTLELYFEDRKTSNFPVRMFDVDYQKDQGVKIDLISQSRNT